MEKGLDKKDQPTIRCGGCETDGVRTMGYAAEKTSLSKRIENRISELSQHSEVKRKEIVEINKEIDTMMLIHRDLAAGSLPAHIVEILEHTRF